LQEKQKQGQNIWRECLLLFAFVSDSKTIEVVLCNLAAWLSKSKQSFVKVQAKVLQLPNAFRRGRIPQHAKAAIRFPLAMALLLLLTPRCKRPVQRPATWRSCVPEFPLAITQEVVVVVPRQRNWLPGRQFSFASTN
jgi:hypothetical protein